MISVRANRVFNVMLVGTLFTVTACAQHAPTQSQGYQAAPQSSSTTNGMTSTHDRVPASTLAAPAPRELASPIEPPASIVRPPDNADDPRAVIDWLLDRSRRGR